MKIAIAGAGGVGGALAALLARSGAHVSLLARGAHGQLLRTRGLRFVSRPSGPLGDFTASLAAVSDRGDELGPADFLLVAVKTFQLPAALPHLRAMTGPRTVVVPLCNGVAAPSQLAAELGAERVAAGIIYVNSWIAEPGVIAQLGPAARVVLGERDGGEATRLAPLARALTAAGLTAELAADLPVRSWEKFLGFEPMAVVGALARSPIGTFRAEPATRSLLVALMEEVAALGRRRGVPLAPDAVTRRLAIIDGLAPDATISLQRDLMAGRVSELEEQSAALLELGRALEVPLPMHAITVPLLQLQERAARAAAPGTRSGGRP